MPRSAMETLLNSRASILNGGRRKLPGVVVIHGGGWVGGSRKLHVDLIQTLFTPDVSLVMSLDQDVIRGQDQVLRAIRDRMKNWDPETRSTITGKEVIKPDGNIALVTYVASVGNQRGIITTTCSRNKDNKWLIAHIHDTWSMPPKK